MDDTINTVNLDIGRRVRTARLESNLCLEQLSARADLMSSQLEAIESGSSRADAKLLARLASILELEIRTFFDDCCNMQHQPSIALIKTAKSNGLFADLIRAERRNKGGLRAA